MYGIAAAVRAANSRLSPRRETATSPASDEEASRPENAAMAIVNANSRCSASGDPASAPGSVRTSGSNSSASPNTMITSWIPRSATTTSAARSHRRDPAPRMLTHAT
jgi:hypothetical protein